MDWIQIREKDLLGRELATLTRSVLVQTRPVGPKGQPAVLVNDRLDIALAENAAGVHLGENSLQVDDARKLVEAAQVAANPSFLIGVSSHSLEGARRAANSGADYLFFGPVFATPSKAAYGPAQGLKRLAEVCRAISIPVLAIGGITAQNAASCMDSGACGVAAIRLFQDAADLPTIVHDLHGLPFH